MNIKEEFTSVLQTGERILGRISEDPHCAKQITDILRVLIKCHLEAAESELSKTELASALILFSDLCPKNTKEKMLILKNLASEIINVAHAVSEESDDDKLFYVEKLASRNSELQRVMLDTVEVVHPEWASTVRNNWQSAKNAARKKDIESVVGLLLYLGLSTVLAMPKWCDKDSGFFAIAPCYIPIFGQIYGVVLFFVKGGFRLGIFAIAVAFLIFGCMRMMSDASTEEAK